MDSLGGLHPVRPASYLVTVSGGASDGPGLRAILRHVTPTVFSTP
ncbi:hypothetical protein [Nocardioides dongxiaopingii]|nr:hypothetical protein [Nocardioides dongxiaopingii]